MSKVKKKLLALYELFELIEDSERLRCKQPGCDEQLVVSFLPGGKQTIFFYSIDFFFNLEPCSYAS